MKRSTLIAIFFLSWALSANDANKSLQLSCQLYTVPSCVGGVSYHCGPPSYGVTCGGDVHIGSRENAERVRREINNTVIEINQ